jgi:hypothetical protein
VLTELDHIHGGPDQSLEQKAKLASFQIDLGAMDKPVNGNALGGFNLFSGIPESGPAGTSLLKARNRLREARQAPHTSST